MHGILFSVNDQIIDRLSGVHRIAHHLRTQGWDIEVVDFFDFWELEELKELLKSRITSKSKFIGFSYIFNRTTTNDTVYKLCEWIKDTYPDLLLVSGGQLDATKNEFIHYHISGYGEYGIDALLNYKFGNGPSPSLSLTSVGKTKVINALHSYPAYPMRDPMIKYEDRDFIMPNEWGKIEFSRGCKFKCAFCTFPVLGVKGDFTRDAESAYVQMMDAYDRFGIQNYVVSDETFNDRTEKIAKFADVSDRLPWDPYFAGYIRADLLVSRPKDREELLRMGFLAHFYGVETFNPKSAKVIGKGMDPAKLQDGLLDVKNWFKERVGKKYRGSMSLIGGLPYETMESLEATRKWLSKNWRDQDAGANVLEIQNLDDYRVSDISINFKKYGYRQISDEQVNDYSVRDFFAGSNIPELIMVQHGSQKGIVWENDYMNIYQANEWSKSVEKLWFVGNHNLLKIDPFRLSNLLCDDKGIPIPFEKKLTLVIQSVAPYYNNFQKYIDNYKNRKLSL